MSEHTPLPWKVEGPTSAIVSAREIKGGRFHVADMRGWGHLTGKGHGALGLDDTTAIAIQEANAALIVKAVNNHEALVAALLRAREAVNAIVLSTRSISFDADLRAIDIALAGAGVTGDVLIQPRA